MTMEELKSVINELYQLMEQEISIYHKLVKEIEVESQSLREGSTDSLMTVVKGIEDHVEMIYRIEEAIQKIIGKILNAAKRGEMDKILTNLIAVLPPDDGRRIKLYQKTLVQLKERVRRLNDRNTSFTREYLAVLTELISNLIHPVNESPVYLRPDNKKPFFRPSYGLNREV